jgi:crossover junction endodeoxyribonuclease RuvC
MKILGVDPGTNITGFGLIDADKLKFNYLTSGCIRTKGELVDKIKIIFNSVNQIITEHKPDIVVLERAFMRPDRPNPDAAIKLGHARGAIIAASGLNNIMVAEYSPNQIKKTVVGKGHSSKDQVLFMVKTLLKLDKSPQIDASDALAGAICHGYHIL